MKPSFVRPAFVRGLVLLLALGAATAALAQHRAPSDIGTDELTPRRAQARSFSLPPSGTASTPLDLKMGRPIVDVMINGKGPYRFFVDTGASHTVIDSALSAELGLPVIGRTHMGDPANPDAIHADQVSIDELAVGDLKFHGVTAASWNQTAGLGGDRSTFPRGVIGFPVWHDLLLTLDYVNGTLGVKQGSLARSAHTIAFTMPEGIVQIPVKVGGNAYDAHLDTGNSDFCVLPAGETTHVRFRGPLQVVGMARTVNSTFLVSGGTLDGSVELADQSYDHPFITVQGTLPRTNVGGRLLQDYAVTFDQRALLVDFERKRVTPPPAQLAGPPGGKVAGVGVSPQDDGSLLVAVILPGSPAAAQDVKVGDHIIKLNGKDTKGMSDDDRRTLMRHSPVTYTIVRDGKQFDVTMQF